MAKVRATGQREYVKGRKGEDSKKRVVLQDDCSTETQMQEWRARLTAARERRLALSSLQPQRDMLNSVNTSSTTGNEDPAGNGHRAADLDTNGSHDPEEIGRLITFVDGQKHLLRIYKREKAFVIGRHRTADFIIEDALVSNMHGRLYTITIDTKEELVCYEDDSRYGTLYNGKTILLKDTVVLNEADTLTIAGRVFKYQHLASQGSFEVGSQMPASQLEFNAFRAGNYMVTPRSLGTGAYAVVRLAVNTTTGLQAACKVMRKRLIKKRGSHDRIKQEMRLMQSLRHPSLVHLQEVLHDEKHYYLFMDLATGGDLFGYISRKSQLDPAESLFVVFQLLKGLDYLHNTLNVAHRDIKVRLGRRIDRHKICCTSDCTPDQPENIILRDHGPYPHIMLSDFGTAKCGEREKTMSFVGTIEYWPPECFTSSYDSKALDCFSTGCCLYAMLSGVFPFTSNRDPDETVRRALKCETSSGDVRTALQIRPEVKKALDGNERGIAKKIISGNMHFGSEFASAPLDAIDFIRCLTASDPDVRHTVTAALAHRWISKGRKDLDALYAAKVRPLSSAGPSKDSQVEVVVMED